MTTTKQRLAEAYRWAQQSPDKSNQNGAVIYYLPNDEVVGHGYNHFYRGVPPTDERPAKYERIAHAEFDACLSMSRDYGHRADRDTAMFCPWATCANCALAIIGSGIGQLYIHADRCRAFMETRAGQNEQALKVWQPAIDESSQWIKDAGIQIFIHEGPVPYDGLVKINGQFWNPWTLEFA